jgi:hypothetical protein
MHAPGYAITAEKDAVLGQDLTGLAGPVPRLSRHRQQPAVVLQLAWTCRHQACVSGRKWAGALSVEFFI